MNDSALLELDGICPVEMTTRKQDDIKMSIRQLKLTTENQRTKNT